MWKPVWFVGFCFCDSAHSQCSSSSTCALHRTGMGRFWIGEKCYSLRKLPAMREKKMVRKELDLKDLDNFVISFGIYIKTVRKTKKN